MEQNIYDHFYNINDDKTALIYNGRIIFYGEVKKKVDLVVQWLVHLGVKGGTPVGVFLTEGLGLIYTLLALGRIKATFIALNAKSTPAAIKELIFIGRPKLVITDARLASKISLKDNKQIYFPQNTIDLLAVNFDLPCSEIKENIFAVLFTSGTTGASKGVYHTLEDFIFVGERCFSKWAITDEERFISGIPMLSAATLGCILFPLLFTGKTLILPLNRTPELLFETSIENEASFIIGTPTVFIKLMDYFIEKGEISYKGREMRGTVAGAPIPYGLIKTVKENCRIELFPHYGMTELLAVTSTGPGDSRENAGKPLPDIDIRVDGSGQIFCKSPALTKGYIDGTLPVLEDGWFPTNDVGSINENGELEIKGRLDDMINRGGNNVFPLEIENLIIKHFNIMSCAVVGFPHPVLGEKIVANIVLPKGSELSEERVQAVLRDYLPAYKIPDEVRFVNEIPVTESGKILKRKMRGEI